LAGGMGSVSLRWVPIRHGAVRQVRLVWLCFVSFSNGNARLVGVWQAWSVWICKVLVGLGLAGQVRWVGSRWDKLGFGTARFGKAGRVRLR
jgi:hypothetical protein